VEDLDKERIALKWILEQ